jgi:hypothetical protein
MPKHSPSILELARRGALARYDELQAEMTSLVRQFPGLVAGAVERTRRAANAAARELSAPPRKRSKMSAAQKKAVSARMKKYWAARRKTRQTE